MILGTEEKIMINNLKHLKNMFFLNHDFFLRPQNHLRSKIVLNTPLSIKLAKIFLNIINTIGPISNPIIPITLKPVYIAIRVKIG